MGRKGGEGGEERDKEKGKGREGQRGREGMGRERGMGGKV